MVKLYVIYILHNFQHRRHSEHKDNDGTETEDDESVLLTEDADPDSEPHSPLKIVSALEEKITPSSSRKGNGLVPLSLAILLYHNTV